MDEKIEKDFWDAIDALIKVPGHNQPVTRDQLDTLHEKISDILGDWPASGFIKICPHIKDPSIKNIARAVRDLRDHNWLHDRCIEKVEDRITSSNSWGRTSYNKKRYDSYPRAASDDMKSFLKDHSIWLTPEQRERLYFLRQKPTHAARDFTL